MSELVKKIIGVVVRVIYGVFGIVIILIGLLMPFVSALGSGQNFSRSLSLEEAEFFAKVIFIFLLVIIILMGMKLFKLISIQSGLILVAVIYNVIKIKSSSVGGYANLSWGFYILMLAIVLLNIPLIIAIVLKKKRESLSVDNQNLLYYIF